MRIILNHAEARSALLQIVWSAVFLVLLAVLSPALHATLGEIAWVLVFLVGVFAVKGAIELAVLAYRINGVPAPSSEARRAYPDPRRVRLPAAKGSSLTDALSAAIADRREENR